jgi:hypothetical protein
LAALVLLFLLKKRKKAIEEDVGDLEECSDTVHDSVTAASDDVFVSEYGFSDRAQSEGIVQDDSDEAIAPDADDSLFGEEAKGSAGEGVGSEDAFHGNE